MPERTQLPRRAAAIIVLAISALACRDIDAPTGPVDDGGAVLAPSAANWVGCEGGAKFTGGGWVEPEGVGRVNFGFNIHGGNCNGGSVKGEIQVVYHANQVIVHSLTVGNFASWVDATRGTCGEWDGTARVKHAKDKNNNDWHEHHYTVEVCDKAEPGKGADRFAFYIDGAGDGVHNNVLGEPLAGGNIQAHKN
jgi:hypothetical protein